MQFQESQFQDSQFQEAVSRMFPHATIPQELQEEGYVVVSDLPRHTRPQNCEVLASGQFQYAKGESLCDSYLVRSGPIVMLVRLVSNALNSLSAQVALRNPAPPQSTPSSTPTHMHQGMHQ